MELYTYVWKENFETMARCVLNNLIDERSDKYQWTYTYAFTTVLPTNIEQN